jgi:two-component system CheB/CheR fusion protein
MLPHDSSHTPLNNHVATPGQLPTDEHSLAVVTPAATISSDLEAANLNDLPPESDSHLLPVVGLGGSAGSIVALQDFFSRVSPDLGMAYVVVLHLSPTHDSLLSEILQTHTSMPVVQVNEAVTVEPNHVYVIPPAFHIEMVRGKIELFAPQQSRGKRVAVDLFFRSLAVSHRSKAVAIVLSGADGDGSIGIKRIKEHGGVTIAQLPEESEVNSMPLSAIQTGMVDWVLPVAEIAEKLREFIENERRIRLPDSQEPSDNRLVRASTPPEDENEVALRDVLQQLNTRTGRDFTHYKRATVLRRIMRRLQVNSLETVPQYAQFLSTHPAETQALLQDLLISVTNFFRDPEAFAPLGEHIPKLFEDKKSSDVVRAWVPGCATGEEAYSLAILLCEYASTLQDPPEIQIFATDLDEEALRQARDGLFTPTILADVSTERLRRFFTHDQGHYRVNKELRESILFAAHDLLKDSPFSRLDLISCRNLLIYFNRSAQNHVFDVFHFAINSGGLLFLGSSETAEENPLFASLDKKHRIYLRHAVSRQQFPLPVLSLPGASAGSRVPRIPNLPRPLPPAPAPRVEPQPRGGGMSFGELHLKLIEQSAPPSVLINKNYEIVHLSENAGKYLRLAGGQISIDFLAIVPAALRLELRAALFRAVQNGESVDVPSASFVLDGQTRMVSLRVRPLREEVQSQSQKSDFTLVIFDEQQPPTEPVAQPLEPDAVAQRLEEELLHLKDYLRASVDQYEASTEELKASNEELQAMNEEQRSASEELETSREEIQAANEELVTLNQELKSKVDEVSRTNDDLQNLMASTDIATIFLSRDLRIKRFTPPAVQLFNLIPTDTGRPLADLRHHFQNEQFIGDAERVLHSLTTIEREVRSANGHWFLLRVLPYRTTEDKIDGVVLTFLDITQRKEAEHTLLERQNFIAAVNDSARALIVVLDIAADKVAYCNSYIRDLLGYSAAEFHEFSISELAELAHPDDAAPFSHFTEKCREAHYGARVSLEFRHKRKDGSYLWVSADGTPFGARDETGVAPQVLVVIEDISERKRNEARMERQKVLLEAVAFGRPLTEILQLTTRTVETLLPGAICAVMIANEEETFLHWTAGDLPEEFGDAMRNLPIAEHAGSCGTAAYQRRRIIAVDITTEPIWEELREVALRCGIRAAWSQPIFSPEGKLYGTFVAYFPSPRAPRGEELGSVEATAQIVGIALDRARKEEAIRASSERFRAIVDQATAGIGLLDLNGRFLEANEQLYTMLDYTSEELMQLTVQEITHPDDLETCVEKLGLLAMQGTPFRTEKRLVRKNGQEIWINASVAAVRDADNRPQSACAVIVDITEQKLAQQKILRANDELEARVEERTHELGIALASVRDEVAQRKKAEIGRDNLLRQIVHAQEAERRRISRELHDNMGQHLTAILLLIQAIESQNRDLPFDDRRATNDSLARLRSMVDELLSVSHRLAWELRPALLDNIGLKAALEQYMVNWSQKSEIKADFMSNMQDQKSALSPDVETALFRVTQEALTNVQRHSGASQVSVVMEHTEDSVSVIVEDNGRGLDLENSDYSDRLGLLGMRERLELVGGTLTLESSEGAGLTIYARVPLAK